MARSNFHLAAENRSIALNFIIKNPGCVLYDLQQHMERDDEAMSAKRVSQIVSRMLVLGELRREPGGIGRSNAPCSRLFAVTTKTISAEAMLSCVRLNLSSGRNGGEKRPVRVMGRIVPVARLFGGL